METEVAEIRRFNRFYTQIIGALDARFLNIDATLPEARVLFEIATRQPVTASTLQTALGMDAGYLSRIIVRFEERDWITRTPGEDDARARAIRLTQTGHEIFAALDTRQRDAVAELLAPMGAVARSELVEALTRARLLLAPSSGSDVTIRPFRTGDVPMVAARQSILYAESHGWGRPLETVESETIAAFLRKFDPEQEQCWIAELDGVPAGAVFLTNEGNNIARLRLLHVEPFARRRGIAEKLVGCCINFAREKNYTAITLWTQSVLEPARRIYTRYGFQRINTAAHTHFGEPLQGETWRLELACTG